MNFKSNYCVDLIGLALLFALLFATFLGNRAFMVPDEGRYVEIPREMNVSGEYITPHLNGIKYFEKPPLFYWLEAATLRFVGSDEWSARLLPLLLGVFGGLMTYVVGRKLYDRATGILASFLLVSSPLYFIFSHMIIPDIALAIFFTGSLFCFLLGIQQPIGRKRSNYFLGIYAFAGLAMLTKGLVAIILPGAIIFSWLLLMNKWQELKSLIMPSGILLFLAIALPWHILVQHKNPEFFHFYFVEQQFFRYATNYAGRGQPIWFMTATIIGGFFPWSIFLLVTPLNAFLNGRFWTYAQQYKAHPIALFFLLWTGIVWLFFSLSHSQLVTYALPVIPPLSLLMARYFTVNWYQKYFTTATYSIISIAVIAVAAAVTAILVVPQQATRFWFLSAALLGLTGIISCCLYYYRGFKCGVAGLIITISCCLISINLNFDSIDNRSVKPLAVKLQSLLKTNDEVITYHEYYQDLPVYLQRRVGVADFSGELTFGMAHQQQKDWMINAATLWNKWQSQNRVYLIIRKKDFDKLSQIDAVYNARKNGHNLPFFLIAKTEKNLLLTNKSFAHDKIRKSVVPRLFP